MSSETPETDDLDRPDHRSLGLPEPLQAAEEQLESFAPSWAVFLRTVRGPEPFDSQPLALRVFLVVAIFGPLLFALYLEWSWRRIVPLWLSLPITLVSLGFAVFRRLRRGRSELSSRRVGRSGRGSGQ